MDHAGAAFRLPSALLSSAGLVFKSGGSKLSERQKLSKREIHLSLHICRRLEVHCDCVGRLHLYFTWLSEMFSEPQVTRVRSAPKRVD
jgi:hypothetical protein